MYKMLVFLISIISLLDLSVAQFVQNGQCDPDIPLVPDFNVTSFLGSWYVTKRFPNPLQNGDCSTLEFAENGGNLTIYNRAVQNNFLEEISANVSQNGTAKFAIHISDFSDPLDFWILPSATYQDNSLAYACENVNTTSRNVYIWQLSRTTSVGDLIEGNMNQTLVSLLGITIDSLPAVDHSSKACHVLPDIAPGQPVVLPGQCNPNINVVQQFNATAFTGVWHEIYSYASSSEIGTCRRAQYQLSESGVDVINSEVVDESLRVIRGNASISSSDGSARLEVTLEVAGFLLRRPLHVLDTDYSSYAVSYSCQNLPNNEKQVTSWILSRSQQLSEAAQNAVNALISSEIDLNSRFYIQTNQTDAACFYLPEFVPNEPVIFPGQCDPNIKGIEKFNVTEVSFQRVRATSEAMLLGQMQLLSDHHANTTEPIDIGIVLIDSDNVKDVLAKKIRYLGLWHNIESYYSTSQRGACSNARYSLNGDVVDVYNTQVVDQALDSITGTAVINSTDGSASLLVSFPGVSNTTNTANYIVLDTDYYSYALVYSCLNINTNQRRVTSFKLSRTKELSNNATIAIEKVINQIPVLDNQYFVPLNQSEEACFYYPEPQPGVPVVFPGKCDDNIEVVQNFSLEQFANVWYEIEAYPIKQGQRHCVNHNLVLSSNTTFSVYSSSVNNQFLDLFNSSVYVNVNESAKMVINLRNQSEQEIPFWILATDYSNYALAYGCVNLPEDFKLIYSWKLSRSKELSVSNRTVIDNIMTNITELENRYYEEVKQSEEGCFFLPEIPEGDPIILSGQCDSNISVVANFNASAYLGSWRLIESYASQFQNGTCNRADYALGENNTVIVSNSEVLNQTLLTEIGSATVLSNGKLLVNFSNSSRPLEYWILDTDYHSYSLVYSCENISPSTRRIWSWKLSRSRDLTSNAIEKINRIIDSIDVLNNRYYEDMDHSDDGCFYYPNPDLSKPVVFPGQCDPNIRVVQNFNASAYMDLWHNIASYPSQFQSGTCNNALYTLQNGTVDVFNTQVINQTLNTINGVARVASTDGSAKLIVNFPKPGGGFTESPYWILATDYSSYALVYSCINLDDERRQVSAWTLSRSKELSVDAIAAINKVSSEIPVLDDKYYIMRNQSDESCFYFPEPNPEVVVEFPGQCEIIQGVPNFNMSLFQGVWHEIEAYPQEPHTRQCVNHEFSLTSNNVSSIISSNIILKELVISNSSVTFASTDSSGNLVIALVSGGQEIRVPFVIVSTDYIGYALAYSCINLPNGYRRVFSWKLSRNKFLTSEESVAINNATENIKVLDNRYYKNISQSDDGCFFLPPPVPGVPVEFFGPCDDSIAVVQNFNVSEYMGRWLLIESYPAPRQEGSCNDATYSLSGIGVDVFNTKVLDQELVTINGTAVLASNDSSAKLLVTFPGDNNEAPYWVLDTDYRSFALVYSCQNIPNNRRRVYSWKLSRTSELTAAASARINQVMSQVNVLESRYFESVNRSDSSCFYYPAPGAESPIFRGRCDENITVVQNFNASGYLGKWYNIESYPVGFQLGSCPTANYEAASVGINVYNTEVVDQRLSDIRGNAVVASVDGSAKLIVLFPISGTNNRTQSPYWVLGTDYSNYALVYSCVNVGSEHRRVSSWKLSRTKSLTSTSTNQINSIMSSVPVVDQRYFRNRGHSDEDCFYYPANNGGPVVQNGQCDINLNIVNNFDIDAFSGDWFEISRFPSELQSGECVSNNFTVNNQTFQLSKTIVYNERQSTFSGVATLPQDKRGVINVNLTDGAGATFVTTFQVLDVVYNDFALLHNCRNLNSTHKQIYSWKLSRSQTGLSQEAIARINNVVANTTELFEDYYDSTDQTVRSCFHYPVFDQLPSSIELIGPCDSTIRAKSNFSVDAYLGKWYEIESYPQAFQNGECARAQYSAGNNSVNVLNTQVVNRTLDARSATAVVASNDSSGLLEVTFSFGNVSNVVNYYVLETDYSNFSLVYSCQNLPNGNRRVSSWKLSREKVLPSHAEPLINNIINNTQGLLQDYYKPTSQSDEDCFYIPQVNKNEAPLFRGQCEIINGTQDFDVQKYLGWWHEIESYPIDSGVGDCVSSNIRAVDNQYQVTDTIVFNNSAQVNTSIVAISNDGRIRKTLSNGVVVDIWVLDTDYETYSLLYSCENANSEYKRVWSAKHSKSRQLTEAAQQAMAPIIARIETLEPQFYLPVNQDDDSCFHYPDQIGKQIILPGQCDLNIPIVQNFTAARYSGTWYQIEKYPQIFENGTCIGARYTLNENTGVVDVLNWQVWNGTLDTIAGNATINSTDGSARLIVNLPMRSSNGSESETDIVSMQLYVLKTDYITYSLVYSCVDIGPFQRAVGAWKLSRTRSLPAAANSEINIYMNTRQELHQPYFETVEQNNDCEEPSSSYLVKSSIIVILICSLLHLLY